MEKYFIIFYAVTGLVMAFEYIYYDSRKNIQHGLFDTGFIMLLFILLWMPISILAIYGYALTALYDIITEEENDK